jgi:hypothetical protein
LKRGRRASSSAAPSLAINMVPGEIALVPALALKSGNSVLNAAILPKHDL